MPIAGNAGAAPAEPGFDDIPPPEPEFSAEDMGGDVGGGGGGLGEVYAGGAGSTIQVGAAVATSAGSGRGSLVAPVLGWSQDWL